MNNNNNIDKKNIGFFEYIQGPRAGSIVMRETFGYSLSLVPSILTGERERGIKRRGAKYILHTSAKEGRGVALQYVYRYLLTGGADAKIRPSSHHRNNNYVRVCPTHAYNRIVYKDARQKKEGAKRRDGRLYRRLLLLCV